jgi:hypothetical protein
VETWSRRGFVGVNVRAAPRVMIRITKKLRNVRCWNWERRSSQGPEVFDYDPLSSNGLFIVTPLCNDGARETGQAKLP